MCNISLRHLGYRIALFAAAVCWAASAAAQTTLTLSVTGSAEAAPDQMVAALTVQETAATAAAAQARVNRTMAGALAAARAVSGVAATTGDYSVSADQNNAGQTTGYQASQDLNLTMPAPGGVPPTPFTSLIGRLQARGLLLNGLNGQLSAAGEDRVRQAAVADALNRLQAEAAAVATALHDRVAGIKTLNLQLNDSGPIRPMMMRAAMAPAPSAAPGPETVTADVDGAVLLLPAP